MRFFRGVPFTGVQVLRWKRVISLHEKKGSGEPQKWSKIVPPSLKPPEALYEEAATVYSNESTRIGQVQLHKDNNCHNAKICNCMSYLDSKRLYCRTPWEMIRGQIFSGMIRIRAQKSELQAESRRYRPERSEIQPKIRTESPRKGPRMGFRCFCRKPPWSPLEST